MGLSNLIAFFIILCTAITLHKAGVTDIHTSAQAAEALRPLAGDFTFLLFSLGIIGTGMLAVPVLAGSAAYATAEAMGFKGSLSSRLDQGEGRGFYTIIARRPWAGWPCRSPPSTPSGTVLGSRAQRRHRRADHGRHDAAGRTHRHHGASHGQRTAAGLGWLSTLSWAPRSSACS